MSHRSTFLAVALAATALVPIAPEPARAADIGATIYVQPWIPEFASHDHVVNFGTYPAIVSDSIKTAWSKTKGILALSVFFALNGYHVAPGVILSGAVGELKDVTDFALSSDGAGGDATVQFRVPNTVIAISVNFKALDEANKYTANIAKQALTPTFDISFDLRLQVSLNVSGNGLTATAVHAFVENPNITPQNDPAKAIKDINDLVAFVHGPNFAKQVEDQFNNHDLANDDLLNSINKGLGPVAQAEQSAATSTGFNLVTMWADHDRLTFYYAPAPRTDFPKGAAMTGNVRWDPRQFPAANCSSFHVYTDVQTGPRPLLASDGESYGNAPRQRIGQFSAHPATSQTSISGNGSCDYTITGLARKWYHFTSATTSALPTDVGSGGNPVIGNLHGVGYMIPVGWDGLSVTPDPLAANKDYQLLHGFAGTSGPGNPHAVLPGQREAYPPRGGDPAARITQVNTPAAPVIVNRLPAPPVQYPTHWPESHGTVFNTRPQAPQPSQTSQPSQPALQTPSAPVSVRPDRARIILGTGQTPAPQQAAQTVAGNLLRPRQNVVLNPQPQLGGPNHIK
jgi:hypothetical protein